MNILVMKRGEILVGRLFNGRLEIYKGMGVKYATCNDHGAPRLPSQYRVHLMTQIVSCKVGYEKAMKLCRDGKC